jgi:hypothetical protein
MAHVTGGIGISFLLTLFVSALAMLLHFGWQAKKSGRRQE